METVESKEGQRLVKMMRRKKTGHGLDILGRISSDYEAPMSEKLPARAAHFLNWCAGEFPGVPIAWNIVVKAIMGYARTPALDGVETAAMAGRASAIRAKLMERFGRGLVNARGQGVRATIDDDDLAGTQLRANVRRLASAKASTARTRDLIDTKAMKNRELREWVDGGVTKALASLDAVERLNKLLPPAPEKK